MKKNKLLNIILTNEDKSDGFKSLKTYGMIIHHYPMIKTSKQQSLQNIDLNDYDLFIFTSRNGVRYFFDMDFAKNKTSIKVICIGSKTEKYLKKNNVKIIYTAKRAYSKVLCEDLKTSGLIDSKKVLLVQGNLAKNNLGECLKKFCLLTKFVSYKTELMNNLDKSLKSLLENSQTYSVFTSQSGFEAFSKLYDARKTNIISIGNTTSDYIRNSGYEPLITSKMQSYEGISDSIISYFEN
tara:strand:+ start:1511 stop:2227 length:717 start_codon:yes stop_codon:yes gene_type:complete